MPGSSTTPGHPGARTYAPVCIAFHLRNSVGTRDMNLCGAQWLAYVLPYRRFAAALTDACARLRVDVDRYSFIVSDLHRLLVAGLPAHCEKFWTLPAGAHQAWSFILFEGKGLCLCVQCPLRRDCLSVEFVEWAGPSRAP